MAAKRPPLRTVTTHAPLVDQGIRKLWLAALEGARDDLRLGMTTKPTVSLDRSSFQRERDWFHSESTDVGSFLWVCQLLGFAPEYWRRGMLGGITPSPYQLAKRKRDTRSRRRTRRQTRRAS